MSLNTHLPGRLRNTPLPRSHGLMPLFEAVVNSIHSIAEVDADPKYGEISIEIQRTPQSSFELEDGKSKRGAPPQENILGFTITDNGAGFNDKNMESFETLDSEYKSSQGCRGVGRLLWLKAFDSVAVSSVYKDANGLPYARRFSFTRDNGVGNMSLVAVDAATPIRTRVNLSGFHKSYRDKSAKTARTIANLIFEHCLWYFVRDGGAPSIRVTDDLESIDLSEVYDEYMFSSSKKEVISIKGNDFELTHLRLKPTAAKPHFVAWCAASRVVEEESLVGKVPGLHGRIKDEGGDFVYACYVTSPFLNLHVRPERIGFDIEEINDDLFSETELSLNEIRNAIISASSRHLDGYLAENQKAGRERVVNRHEFARHPRAFQNTAFQN